MGQLLSSLYGGGEEKIAQIPSDDPTFHDVEPGPYSPLLARSSLNSTTGSTKYSADQAVHCREDKIIAISCDALEQDLLISTPSDEEVDDDIWQHRFVSATPTKLPGIDSNIAISSAVLEDLLVKAITEKIENIMLQLGLVNARPTELPSMKFDQPLKKSELMKKKRHRKKKTCIQIERKIKHYSSSQKILLVGEGDFSFSACLAKAFSSASNMVATSLDSKKFLLKNYSKAHENIAILKSRGCWVIHGVDATQMASYEWLYDETSYGYDRIVYNFPLAGFFQGMSRKKELKLNRRLILKFLENAMELVSSTGEIHITHKTTGFFFEWNLEQLASMSGLRLIEKVPFNLKDYEGYNTKYGFGGDDNFNCNPSTTYKFGFKVQSNVK